MQSSKQHHLTGEVQVDEFFIGQRKNKNVARAKGKRDLLLLLWKSTRLGGKGLALVVNCEAHKKAIANYLRVDKKIAEILPSIPPIQDWFNIP